MEYIKGDTLKEVIKKKGKLSEDETIYYSLQIAKALKHAHLNHIVHRDIKPQNIMITEDNGVKVTDFGIALAVSSSTIINSTDILGSVHYSSPEQFRGGYVDEKSDIYSLGIVMYEMITGKIPFDGESPVTIALKHSQEDIISPSEINDKISKELESIILKALEKRQGDRYENAGAIIKDLNAIKSPNGLYIKNLDRDMESATQVIPHVKDEEVNNLKKTKTKKNKNNKSDGGWKMILSAILLAFLVVSLVFFGYTKLSGYLSAEEVIVPDLRGMEEDMARDTLEDLGLKLNVVGKVKNPEYPEGQIVNQSSEPDSKVKEGFTIDVNISEGQGLVEVPSLVNKTLEEAERILKNTGLSMGIPKYEASDTIAEDIVMKQDPLPSEMLESGSKVNLTVSQGEELSIVIMPELVGKDIIEAKNIIRDKKLEVGDVVPQYSEDKKEGIVTWQSYLEGSEIESKTAVDLYVSKGPDPEQEPVEPEEPVEPVEPEKPDKSENKTITFTLTPFTDRESTEIKIVAKKDGTSVDRYKESHKNEDGNVVIELQGVIGTEFEVYFDDIYQYSQTIKD